jgi:hypothetical protein
LFWDTKTEIAISNIIVIGMEHAKILRAKIHELLVSILTHVRNYVQYCIRNPSMNTHSVSQPESQVPCFILNLLSAYTTLETSTTNSG